MSDDRFTEIKACEEVGPQSVAWLIAEVERLRYDDSPGTLLARFKAVTDYVEANIDQHARIRAKPIELTLIEDHARLHVAASILAKMVYQTGWDVHRPDEGVWFGAVDCYLQLTDAEIAFLAAAVLTEQGADDAR